MLSDDDVRELGAGGFVVRDGLLGPELAAACRTELLGPAIAAGLHLAGMGTRRHRDDNARGDTIGWLEITTGGALAQLVARFEAIRCALNEAAWLGLADFEMQVARFAPGTRYVRHFDAFRGRPGRRATAIWYANADWRPEHGGRLRVFPEHGPVEVDPVLDRMVLFLADRLEHEVLPSYADRWAVTAWFRGPDRGF